MKRIISRNNALLHYLILLLALPVMIIGLAGCATPEAADVSGEAVAEVVLEPTAAPATPTDDASVESELEAEVVEPSEPDNCLDCHSNKELLIDTADPVEEVINENEGEG